MNFVISFICYTFHNHFVRSLSILFSLTYSSISLIKGIPYFVAFPFPTPEIFEISSIVIGYILLISMSDGSEKKIIDGGREILIASFFLKSLSKEIFI